MDNTRSIQTRANSQQAPTFARLASGGLVATWRDNGTIVAQLHDASGARVGAEFSVAASAQPSQVTGLAGGGFVIGWIGTDSNNSAGALTQQVVLWDDGSTSYTYF